MGACAAKQQSGDPEQLAADKAISAQLKKDRVALAQEVKLLLLGTGESGKSTIAKQMKILYKEGYTDEERLQFISIIHSNIIMAMRAAVDAAERNNVEFPASLQGEVEMFTTNEILFEPKLTDTISKAVKALWENEDIKSLCDNGKNFNILDSSRYFFGEIDRISREDYKPSDADLLYARARTTGIAETSFELAGVKWRLMDVGGQRNERRKWIHCFQGLTALIFCVAASEYNQKLYEDDRVNRMHESLILFEEICNCQWFVSTGIILFLNKMDLLKEKIKKVDLKECFEDYTGGLDFNNAFEFIKAKFLELNKNKSKPIYVHATCATDTENIRFVFNSVKDIVLRDSLQRYNLL